jgi:diguanylate cyclase (GGDEF)-like protein
MLQEETKIRDQALATILIVESQGGHHAPLTTLLRHHGHRVLVAVGTEEALQIVRAEEPDLVLADVLMPDMDGFQFVMRLREEKGLAQPQVVFRIAAHMEAEARKLAGDYGVVHFVAMSAESETLLAAIQLALSAPPPRPVKPHSAAAASGARRYSLAFGLQKSVAGLENFNAQLERRLSEYAAQLMAARSALEQEVTKRIWAEKELTEANLRLHDEAVRDALTGLHNRRYLEESLNREMSRARRSGRSIGVMMIDIDHFKQCNDTFGHAAGDAVLHALGQHLLSLTRGEDILCRYGGEEFVLVMTNASARAAWERAEALRVGAQELKVEHESRQIGPVTLSIGIALLPDHGESGRAVLQVADAALYQAKQMGRNRVVLGGGLQA